MKILSRCFPALAALLAGLLFLGGAWTLHAHADPTPAFYPVKPAPAMAAGDDRTYVGQKICTACHQQEASNWAHTVHAAVFTLNPRDAAEARGCEACHGPGSAHVKKPADLSTIISFSHKSVTPIAQQNAQCLSCHQGGQRLSTTHGWRSNVVRRTTTQWFIGYTPVAA